MEFGWLRSLIGTLLRLRSSGEERKDSRDDFKAVTDAAVTVNGSWQGLYQALKNDMEDLKKEMRLRDQEKSIEIKQLKVENAELRRQHQNCEAGQRALQCRVAELETDMKRYQQRSGEIG
ncbi:hypothetical protein SH668x_001245 [Planctomicrobium sp. SH668]|uniref:hypothetical protein n=1 Tax=Planctomicrobium sp. SH668 TaxID=3448126 RepID=UPI003F5CAACB